MTNEELNHEVAVKVMGEDGIKNWAYRDPKHRTVFDFSPATDANHARDVEVEIARRGLGEKWLIKLAQICAESEKFSLERGLASPRWFDLKIVTASPADRCRAALKAVEEAQS